MAPSLAKIPCCNVSKIITKIMYVVHLNLSVATTIQFEIHL
jgi:predicted transcriptional regulator